jgi:predicted PurR-regulated permease PerM
MSGGGSSSSLSPCSWRSRSILSSARSIDGACAARSAVVGFLVLSGSALKEQAGMLGQHLSETRQQIESWIPGGLGSILPPAGAGSGSQDQQSSGQSAGSGMMLVVRTTVSAVLSIVVALVLTAYLLIDGRRTYEWFVAFAPPARRPKIHKTAREARSSIIAYMRGNVATSVLTMVATFIVLSALNVPASLLLAVVAGILNFVPVVGLLVSLVPAVLLALTVSPTVAIGVAAFYLGYNAVESYYIQPKVYGYEMQLSSIAVLAAFAIGAELGGVIGALIALPVAAMYPAVESIWLKGKLDPDSVEDHRRIERSEEH